MRNGLGRLTAALSLASIACGTSPTAPSADREASGAATAVRDAAVSSSAQPATASTTATASCEPTVTRDDVNQLFFIVTLTFPRSDCQWSARNNERGYVYWTLTAPDWDLRNRVRYLQGATGRGTSRLGVHFPKTESAAQGLTHSLDICLGVSCGPLDTKIKSWPFQQLTH